MLFIFRTYFIFIIIIIKSWECEDSFQLNIGKTTIIFFIWALTVFQAELKNKVELVSLLLKIVRNF